MKVVRTPWQVVFHFGKLLYARLQTVSSCHFFKLLSSNWQTANSLTFIDFKIFPFQVRKLKCLFTWPLRWFMSMQAHDVVLAKTTIVKFTGRSTGHAMCKTDSAFSLSLILIFSGLTSHDYGCKEHFSWWLRRLVHILELLYCLTTISSKVVAIL